MMVHGMRISLLRFSLSHISREILRIESSLVTVVFPLSISCLHDAVDSRISWLNHRTRFLVNFLLSSPDLSCAELAMSRIRDEPTDEQKAQAADFPPGGMAPAGSDPRPIRPRVSTATQLSESCVVSPALSSVYPHGWAICLPDFQTVFIVIGHSVSVVLLLLLLLLVCPHAARVWQA